jgi:hypothetical protein
MPQATTFPHSSSSPQPSGQPLQQRLQLPPPVAALHQQQQQQQGSPQVLLLQAALLPNLPNRHCRPKSCPNRVCHRQARPTRGQWASGQLRKGLPRLLLLLLLAVTAGSSYKRVKVASQMLHQWNRRPIVTKRSQPQQQVQGSKGGK